MENWVDVAFWFPQAHRQTHAGWGSNDRAPSLHPHAPWWLPPGFGDVGSVEFDAIANILGAKIGLGNRFVSWVVRQGAVFQADDRPSERCAQVAA